VSSADSYEPAPLTSCAQVATTVSGAQLHGSSAKLHV
jgi:hypothetical protein